MLSSWTPASHVSDLSMADFITLIRQVVRAQHHAVSNTESPIMVCSFCQHCPGCCIIQHLNGTPISWFILFHDSTNSCLTPPRLIGILVWLSHWAYSCPFHLLSWTPYLFLMGSHPSTHNGSDSEGAVQGHEGSHADVSSVGASVPSQQESRRSHHCLLVSAAFYSSSK